MAGIVAYDSWKYSQSLDQLARVTIACLKVFISNLLIYGQAKPREIWYICTVIKTG